MNVIPSGTSGLYTFDLTSLHHFTHGYTKGQSMVVVSGLFIELPAEVISFWHSTGLARPLLAISLYYN